MKRRRNAILGMGILKGGRRRTNRVVLEVTLLRDWVREGVVVYSAVISPLISANP